MGKLIAYPDVTVSEAARRLKISVQRVRAIIRAGALPARKFGHVYVIPGDEFIKFAKKVRPTGRKKKGTAED